MKYLRLFSLFVILALLEGIVASYVTIEITADAKNAFAFGLSLKRIIIIFSQFLCILALLFLLYASRRVIKLFALRFNSDFSNRVVTALGIISIFLLWVTIFIPTKDLLQFEANFIRSKPTLIWLELMILQFSLWIKISKSTFNLQAVRFNVSNKTLALTFISLLLLWVIISVTKVGLVKDTAYWNVPGIPLSSIQFYGILLFLFLFMIFYPQDSAKPNPFSKPLEWMIPLGIFAFAVLFWGFTPMFKHFFTLPVTPPNMQPFPYSDARVHDLGALSILMGKGVYFHGYTDKPLYMLFLAILHVFSGNDYNLLQWAQIVVLAFIPVVLYFFGKRIFNPLFGILIAVIVVFQQRNSIALSYKVASVNPKLLMTEELTLLGIVVLTYLLFLWMKKPEPKKLFLLGGLIGALSLVRINPIFALPIIAAIILIRFLKMPKMLFKQVLLLNAGFLLVFSPWLFTGVNPEGKSWFFLKIQDVINVRYSPQTEVILPSTPQVVLALSSVQENPLTMNISYSFPVKQAAAITTEVQFSNESTSVPWLMISHFLHNFSASILALPDSIKALNLFDLTAREYWQDQNQWNGNFPIGQYVLILGNLLILSIGIAYSWKQNRWSGLAPLIVFLAYDLSLGAALNSGSRYIVPINWIIFFYYALGLIRIAFYLLNILDIKTPFELPEVNSAQIEIPKATFKSWLPTIAILLPLAASLPVVNLVLPEFVHPKVNPNQLLLSMSSKETSQNQLIPGIIFYPYYQEDGTLSFDFLAGTNVSSYQVSQRQIISTYQDLESGIPAVLSINRSNGVDSISSIYLSIDNNPQLFWKWK
jgi:hypothetical protein